MDSAGLVEKRRYQPHSGAVVNTPSAAILGFGHLGRPLAEALYQQGYALSALKHRLTSDDLCLPLRLDAADLNQEAVWQQPFWAQYWADKSAWICLLPPSKMADYNGVIGRWLALAERFQVAHLVYGSSISVYGDAVRTCDEHTPPQPDTASAAKVLAAEQQMLASAIPQVSILRLGGLYAAERHPIRRLLAKPPVRAPYAPANMLHRDRAVAALLQAVQHPDGRRLRNVVETPAPNRLDFYTREAANLGLPVPQFDGNDMSGGKRVVSCYAGLD